MTNTCQIRSLSVILLLIAHAPTSQAGLPPVPVPVENPITEGKRILGKILFWDEQLSTDNTVACGTCHTPSAAGSDTRVGLHPGPDGLFATQDDSRGSRGVIRRDQTGQPIEDPVFGFNVQVTDTFSPNFFAGIFGSSQFWDGRAEGPFIDPLDGTTVVIAAGGSLEIQALAPILSDVEMAKQGRTWQEVTDKLATVNPLEFAGNIPADMAAVLTSGVSYGDLFNNAFGDPAITPVRIALAIATYERTLVPDASPFDLGTLNTAEMVGRNVFFGFGPGSSPVCSQCHGGPDAAINTFTDNSFRNIGVAFDPIGNDPGRSGVTGLPVDVARFKVPSLRNVGVKPFFMHNGTRLTLTDVVLFYQAGSQNSLANISPLIPAPVLPTEIASLVAFMQTGLLDPRVAAGSFPFDAPTLSAAGELLFPPPAAVPGLSPAALVVLASSLLLTGIRRRNQPTGTSLGHRHKRKVSPPRR
jgi:cytochrome c peroxidase